MEKTKQLIHRIFFFLSRTRSCTKVSNTVSALEELIVYLEKQARAQENRINTKTSVKVAAISRI